MKIFDLGFLDSPSESRFVATLYKILIVVLFAFILQAAFLRNMQNYTDHDDNPYNAGAKVTAEEGLLPYKDYRLIHMPYYVFTYALILEFTPSLTLSARIISLASFFTMLVLIFYSIQNSLYHKNQIFRFVIGASALLFIMYNPFVQYAFARFTYDFPLLLSMLSFLVLSSTDRSRRLPLKAAISGLLLGVAVGFRMHFIFFIIPFALSILLFQKESTTVKFKQFLYFSLGVFAGLIPVFILISIAPKGFLFDIYQFHFKIDMKAQPGAALSLGEKLTELFDKVLEKWQSSVLLAGLILALILKAFNLVKDNRLNFKINVLLITLPFLVYLSVGKLLIIQYVYPLSVFLIVVIFYTIGTQKNYFNYVAILFFVLSIIPPLKVNYKKAYDMKTTESWYALSRHRISTLVDEAINGEAKVLTLSPAEILESDSIKIYKEFVSSPFIWRTSHSISDDTRKEFNIISKKEVDNFMQTNQPDAILTGYYLGDLELKFVEFAQKNGYKKVDLPTERELKLYIKEK
ncbi:hypothetical protein [Draconibacterium mangrovi]|uniref:hypothetical protein n=1 Tax=Draconibacterium mangrovi TaxID=2697469 RepID=UPI0013D36FA6|nr:hypothetical protein [Draconibacterium mangrovi]